MATTDPFPFPFTSWPSARRRSHARPVGLRRLLRRARGCRGLAVLAGAIALTAGPGAFPQDASAAARPAKRGAASLPRGVTVIAVQRALGVAADGVYGPLTHRALRRFQRRRGLVVDGIIGPRTLAALGLSAKRATARSGGPSALLERIARCESGGDPTIVSASGRYRGKYQFSRATWRAMGGKGDPAEAPEAEQDRRAAALLAARGTAPWPNCA